MKIIMLDIFMYIQTKKNIIFTKIYDVYDAYLVKYN